MQDVYGDMAFSERLVFRVDALETHQSTGMLLSTSSIGVLTSGLRYVAMTV